MFVYILYSLYYIYITAGSRVGFTVVRLPTIKNIETIVDADMELNDNDTNTDVKFLDDIEKVIDKVKIVIDDHVVHREYSHQKTYKLTNFILDAIDVLNKYDDDDIKQIILIIHDEITKYHYRGCKFYELTENGGLRKYIASKLDEYSNLSASEIRKNLATISRAIKENKFDRNQRDLLNLVNSLYMSNAAGKFKDVLDNFDAARLKTRKNIDLVDIVKRAFRSVFFDHYTNLNVNARSALRSKVNEYWSATKSESFYSEVNYVEEKTYNTDQHHIDDNVIHTSEFENVTKSKKAEANYNKYDADSLTTRRQMSYVTLYPEYIIDEDNSNPISKLEKKHAKAITVKNKLRHTDKSKEKLVIEVLHKPHHSQRYKKLHAKPKTTVNAKTSNMIKTTQQHGSGHNVFIEVMTMRPFVPKKTNTSKKFKYEINFKKPSLRHQAHLKKPNLLTRHPIGLLIANTTVPEAIELEYISSKWKTASTKQYGLSTPSITNISNTRMYDDSQDNSTSIIDNDYDDDVNEGFYRNNNKNNHIANDKVAIDKNVLSRLRHLNNELKVVKIRTNKKAEVIKELKRKTRGPEKKRSQFKRTFKNKYSAITPSTRKLVITDFNSQKYTKYANSDKENTKVHIRITHDFNKLLYNDGKNNDYIHGHDNKVSNTNKHKKEHETKYYKSDENIKQKHSDYKIKGIDYLPHRYLFRKSNNQDYRNYNKYNLVKYDDTINNETINNINIDSTETEYNTIKHDDVNIHNTNNISMSKKNSLDKLEPHIISNINDDNHEKNEYPEKTYNEITGDNNVNSDYNHGIPKYSKEKIAKGKIENITVRAFNTYNADTNEPLLKRRSEDLQYFEINNPQEIENVKDNLKTREKISLRANNFTFVSLSEQLKNDIRDGLYELSFDSVKQKRNISETTTTPTTEKIINVTNVTLKIDATDKSTTKSTVTESSTTTTGMIESNVRTESVLTKSSTLTTKLDDKIHQDTTQIKTTNKNKEETKNDQSFKNEILKNPIAEKHNSINNINIENTKDTSYVLYTGFKTILENNNMNASKDNNKGSIRSFNKNDISENKKPNNNTYYDIQRDKRINDKITTRSTATRAEALQINKATTYNDIEYKKEFEKLQLQYSEIKESTPKKDFRQLDRNNDRNPYLNNKNIKVSTTIKSPHQPFESNSENKKINIKEDIQHHKNETKTKYETRNIQTTSDKRNLSKLNAELDKTTIPGLNTDSKNNIKTTTEEYNPLHLVW